VTPCNLVEIYLIFEKPVALVFEFSTTTLFSNKFFYNILRFLTEFTVSHSGECNLLNHYLGVIIYRIPDLKVTGKKENWETSLEIFKRRSQRRCSFTAWRNDKTLEDQTDDGETKINLRSIGRGFNDQSIKILYWWRIPIFRNNVTINLQLPMNKFMD